jgi:hypothetical protein
MRLKSTFTVTLESPDGNATFVFKKPKANKIFAAKTEENDVKANFYMLTEDLVSVDGLENEDGSKVKVEDLKSLDLDFATLRAIIEGYNAGAFPKIEQDSGKKNS